MAFQFRKRFKISPGFSLNIGKRGVSVSGGVRGARHTVGTERSTTSIGLPGTGISSRSQTSTAQRRSEGYGWGHVIVVLVVLGAIAKFFGLV